MDMGVDNKLHPMSYIRIRKPFCMGISVPISTEYYKLLKEISDDLGLGLKRTVEFLVGYYKENEMICKASAEKISQVQPDKIGIAHEALQSHIQEKMQPIASSTTQNSTTHPAAEKIPSIKSAPATIEIKTQKSNNPPNYPGSETSSPRLLATKSLTTEKLSPNVATKLLEQAYRSTQNCCYSCGFPKKPNAKFCSNCGTLLQVKS